MNRIATVTLLILLWGVVAFFAIRWAREPLHRRQHFVEIPLSLTAGTTTTTEFEPITGYPHELFLRIKRKPGIRDMEAVLAGRFPETDRPRTPLILSYAIRRGGVQVQGGEISTFPPAGFAFQGARWRGTHDKFRVAPIPEGGRGNHTLEVTVIQAPAELAQVETTFVMGVIGDYISYAWLDALVRQSLVAMGLFLGIVLAAVAVYLRKRRARSTASPEAV